MRIVIAEDTVLLREGLAFSLYASPEVHAALDASRIFNALDRSRVPRISQF